MNVHDVVTSISTFTKCTHGDAISVAKLIDVEYPQHWDSVCANTLKTDEIIHIKGAKKFTCELEETMVRSSSSS